MIEYFTYVPRSYFTSKIIIQWFTFPFHFSKYSCDFHVEKYCQNELKKSNQCFLVDCQFKYLFKSSLIDHLTDVHEMDIRPAEEFLFKTWLEFLTWKEGEEDATMSIYSLQTGEKKGHLYYYCQHDGPSKKHYKPNSEAPVSKRKPRVKGRVKTDDVCISMMKVHKAEDGSVRVKYFPTHSHSIEKNSHSHRRRKPVKSQLNLCKDNICQPKRYKDNICQHNHSKDNICQPKLYKDNILSLNSELTELLQNDKVPHQLLSHVEEVLSKLLAECRPAVDTTSQASELKSSDVLSCQVVPSEEKANETYNSMTEARSEFNSTHLEERCDELKREPFNIGVDYVHNNDNTINTPMCDLVEKSILCQYLSSNTK